MDFSKENQILRLQPFGAGAEYLKPIDLHLGQNELHILGRNFHTAIDTMGTSPNAQYVSRAHLQVHVKGLQVFIRPLAREKNLIFLNGSTLPDEIEVEIKVYDKLSLLGSLGYFNFEVTPIALPIEDEDRQKSKKPKTNDKSVVELVDSPVSTHKSSGSVIFLDDSDSADNKDRDIAPLTFSASSNGSEAMSSASNRVSPDGATALPAPAPVPTPVANEFFVSLLRQYECSICFDSMACPVSLTPCGDTFCFGCIRDCLQGKKKGEGKCPHCMAVVSLSAAIPNRIVEHSVREILTQMKDEGSLQAWEERSKAGLEQKKESEGKGDKKREREEEDVVEIQEEMPRHYRFMNRGGRIAEGDVWEVEGEARGSRVGRGSRSILPGESLSINRQELPRFGVPSAINSSHSSNGHGSIQPWEGDGEALVQPITERRFLGEILMPRMPTTLRGLNVDKSRYSISNNNNNNNAVTSSSSSLDNNTRGSDVSFAPLAAHRLPSSNHVDLTISNSNGARPAGTGAGAGLAEQVVDLTADSQNYDSVFI